MNNIRRYAKYLFSPNSSPPKLYRIYNQQSVADESSSSNAASSPSQHRPPFYTPSILESLTDATITYILPITLLLSVYNRKVSYLQLSILLYLTSRFLRTLSRLTNPEYSNFLTILEDAGTSPNSSSLHTLRTTYDFSFSHFPVTHTTTVSVHDWKVNQQQQSSSSPISYYTSHLIAHTFGIRLIYPGLLLGSLLRSVLEDGREKLVVDKKGVRVKIRVRSEDVVGFFGSGFGHVDLDAMVFDNRKEKKRSDDDDLGQILVICCEGNAGFYEIGMLGGALSEGYSVLGWNHPGFGGSTGTPYPETELSAALGVMDYALNVLGFRESEIMVYGWSIGGFPASYLASRYPGIRGLLLDATFDHILPLAIPRMPEFMTPLVISTIQNHVNLDVTSNLAHYPGPLRIVRRTDDEIIADPPGVLKSNRGNQLLVDVVVRRWKRGGGGDVVDEEALGELVEWVGKPHHHHGDGGGGSSSSRRRKEGDLLLLPGCDDLDSLSGVEYQWQQQHGDDVGRALIGIACSILRDYKSTHCTPLPREFYRVSRISSEGDEDEKKKKKM